MNILKQQNTYGAIALMSLFFWGNYAKPNHARQIELTASQPFIALTSSETKVSKAENCLPSTKEYSRCNPNSANLTKANLENAVLANLDLNEANIMGVDLTQINLKKINLRYILMLEIAIVALIMAYTFLRLP